MRTAILLSVVLFMATAGWAQVVLQDAYDAAGPGAGYDKMVYLDRYTMYTGGLFIPDGVDACILSYGALVDLEGNSIGVGPRALLDISGVVLINSGGGPAIKYVDAGDGWVDHCTFSHNYDGLYFWQGSEMRITSNIFYNSAHFGVACHQYSDRWMAYNDVWQNAEGDYMQWACDG